MGDNLSESRLFEPPERFKGHKNEFYFFDPVKTVIVRLEAESFEILLRGFDPNNQFPLFNTTMDPSFTSYPHAFHGAPNIRSLTVIGRFDLICPFL